MVFDLDEKDDGTWFPFFESRIDDTGKVVYDDPKPDGGRVRVRNIGPFIQEKFAKRKRKFEFVFNPSSRAMERVGYYEELTPEQAKTESEDTWDYCITGIEGFVDKKNKPIKCTRENKIKLMALPVFDRFIGRCLQLMGNVKDEGEAELEKNS